MAINLYQFPTTPNQAGDRWKIEDLLKNPQAPRTPMDIPSWVNELGLPTTYTEKYYENEDPYQYTREIPAEYWAGETFNNILNDNAEELAWIYDQSGKRIFNPNYYLAPSDDFAALQQLANQLNTAMGATPGTSQAFGVFPNWDIHNEGEYSPEGSNIIRWGGPADDTLTNLFKGLTLAALGSMVGGGILSALGGAGAAGIGDLAGLGESIESVTAPFSGWSGLPTAGTTGNILDTASTPGIGLTSGGTTPSLLEPGATIGGEQITTNAINSALSNVPAGSTTGNVLSNFLKDYGGIIGPGVSVLGNLVAGKYAGEAAETQSQAAQDIAALEAAMAQAGIDAQSGIAQQLIDLYKTQFDTQMEMIQPWQEAGVNALGELGGMLEAGPGEFTESPGYQFQLSEGLKALERANAASGRIGSGGYDKAVMRYAEGLANQEYDDFLNRWYQSLAPYQSLAGLTPTQTGATNALQTSTAGQASALQGLGNVYQTGYNQLANAQAGGVGGAGQASANYMANMGNIWGQTFGGIGQNILDYAIYGRG